MAKFKVGDVCILVDSTHHKHLIGCELKITGEIVEFLGAIDGKKCIGYPTDLVCPVTNFRIWPKEENLRLKKFPGEEQVMKLFTEVTKRDVVTA